MGLLGDSFKAMRMKDPVDGVAQVVGSTQPPHDSTSANVHLTLVLQAEGFPATNVELNCIAPTKKWPYPGEQLPVTFDRSDPERVKVRWDDVPSGSQVAADQAEALAAAMNQGGAGGAQVQGGDPAAIVEALQQAMPGAQVQVGGAQGAGAAAPQGGGGDERMAQLERLAKLKETGALTDAEFEREKARILGEG